MPERPKRQCRGCTRLVTTGWCENCQKAGKGKDDRRTSSQRGYDAVWNRFRHWFLQRHPVCEDCKRAASRDVHHIKKLRDYPELRLVEENCMGLCGTCHKIRTARGE